MTGNKITPSGAERLKWAFLGECMRGGKAKRKAIFYDGGRNVISMIIRKAALKRQLMALLFAWSELLSENNKRRKVDSKMNEYADELMKESFRTDVNNIDEILSETNISDEAHEYIIGIVMGMAITIASSEALASVLRNIISKHVAPVTSEMLREITHSDEFAERFKAIYPEEWMEDTL